VWLNEAQFYLDVAAGELGERVAAGLRELLRDPARGPVLVLATLWPQYWHALTARPSEGADPHGQARELLAGRDITVPAAFTAGQVRYMSRSGDPRLALAMKAAENGQVTQFLAGAPELMARYRNAPTAAAALISAATDARRLGMGVALPLTFLEQAAPGYLTDTEWNALGEDWLGQALAYAAAPANGTRAPLSRIRHRPADGASPDSAPAYRLADYRDQHGRRARRALIPPDDFWQAASRFADYADLPALAKAAENRGLLRDAARFRKKAAAHGNAAGAADLIRNWHHPHATDLRPGQWVTVHARLDDPVGVASLLGSMREAGAERQCSALLARVAAHVSLGGPAEVAHLLNRMREAGAEQQAKTLVGRLPAEGYFGLFTEQPGLSKRYVFGRELDGSPAPSWNWDDLG
jgi:hypothetical protein